MTLDLQERPRTVEEKKELAQQYSYFVLVDRSQSMSSPCHGSTRWEIVRSYLSSVVQEAARFSTEGVHLGFFDHRVEWLPIPVTKGSEIKKSFSEMLPRGSTNLSRALQETFAKHFAWRREKEKIGDEQRSIIFIITDGEPDHPQDVMRRIIRATRRLTEDLRFTTLDRKTGEPVEKSYELGIQILHIGNEPEALQFCNRLDEHLIEEGAEVDCIDSNPLCQISLKRDFLDLAIDSVFN